MRGLCVTPPSLLLQVIRSLTRTWSPPASPTTSLLQYDTRLCLSDNKNLNTSAVFSSSGLSSGAVLSKQKPSVFVRQQTRVQFITKHLSHLSHLSAPSSSTTEGGVVSCQSPAANLKEKSILCIIWRSYISPVSVQCCFSFTLNHPAYRLCFYFSFHKTTTKRCKKT